MGTDRDLVWDGCLNVRDLGGHPTTDGGETRFGSIVRADSVSQLTECGWAALVEHGIRTVIDLRGDHEREDDSPRELEVDVQHVPFMEANEREWEEIGAEIEAAAAAAPDIETSTRDVYLIFLERFKANVGASVRAVARAPEGGLVVHCVGGKDRTGLLAALLLRLVGVPMEVVEADYVRSEAPRHVIGLVLGEAQARHGSTAEYLLHAGASEAELERIGRRFLTRA